MLISATLRNSVVRAMPWLCTNVCSISARGPGPIILLPADRLEFVCIYLYFHSRLRHPCYLRQQ